MKQRLILIGFAAIVAALFALPGSASAGEWKAVPASGKYPMAITAKAGVTKLTGAGGFVIECTSLTATGQYSTATTGVLTVVLHGCVDLTSKTPCTSKMQPAGTIAFTTMAFHNVYLEPNKTTPGMLFQANIGHFGEFKCDFGLVNIEVTGNGVIGDLTSPKCGETKATATLDWEASGAGVQKWMTKTTDPSLGAWDAKARINAGSAFTAALESDVTLTYAENTTVSCT